jgi:cyclase
MLKTRIIPILTFNGFALVKTKNFSNPRMVGNPVQSARVYNSRGVDELIFLDIFASKQNRKVNLNVVRDVVKECFMPVGIGGGINSLDDINDLLKIGADKVVVKNEALKNPQFVNDAANFFGSQCISISLDAIRLNDNYFVQNNLGINIELSNFIKKMSDEGAGEFILNSVDNDGMMNGFDLKLINYVEKLTNLPIVCVGGGGDMSHYVELFSNTNCDSVGSSSIFHFTQFTPSDIKEKLHLIGKPVRL